MTPAPASRLRCAACGAAPGPDEPYPFRCPNAGRDGADHVLVRRLEPGRARFEVGDSSNPFVRHRELLHSHARARALGIADADFVACVESLDAAVERVDGTGFRETPLRRLAPLDDALGTVVLAKDETGNVGGSHKARHLFGIALHLEVSERAGLVGRGTTDRRGLAIASCGNAALAAAVVARAGDRPLRVFVPTDADPAVLERLHALGADVAVCPRRPGVAGDPCLHAFTAAGADGALPFCVQGSENGLTIEGGMTLGWELAAQLARAGGTLDRLFVQVGGGALASATFQALREARAYGVIARLPRLHAVQTFGARPLRRAWERVRDRGLGALGERPVAGGEGADADAAAAGRLARADAREAVREALAHARANRAAYMWPWETPPASVAHGILDDETYDWAAVVEGMLETGGWPVTAAEGTLVEARDLARSAGVLADATGASGLAGALELRRAGGIGGNERLGVLLTGVDREG